MNTMEYVEQKQLCARCGHAFRDGDRYCSQCGYRRDAPVPWYYRPLWIVVLTVTVLGPFSIVLVLKSPLISRKNRIVFSVAIALGTLWFCYYLYQVFAQALLQINEAFEMD